jgi:hypothetical protein
LITESSKSSKTTNGIAEVTSKEPKKIEPWHIRENSFRLPLPLRSLESTISKPQR